MDQQASLTAAVIGASGGIGRAVVDALLADPRYARVYCLSRSGRAPAHAHAVAGQIDLQSEASIGEAAEAIAEPLDLVFVATGLLSHQASPEKSWRALDAETLAHVYAINAVGPALVAKHFLPKLPRDRRAVFAAVSARVGSITDNRIGGWHAYRASKAGLNMLIRCLAIELQRSHKQALCVGLHPGTVDTALSQPFQRNVKPEKLFDPAFSAQRLLAVLDGLSPEDSGGLFAWDGKPIPF
ncbi:MAG: SDR family NAD(P)-dependent oxidoreductase [Rhodothalassiaceae bacterium]